MGQRQVQIVGKMMEVSVSAVLPSGDLENHCELDRSRSGNGKIMKPKEGFPLMQIGI